MKVTVKESSIVRPADDTPRQCIWLSNQDLVQGNYHLPLAYMYKPDGSSDFFDVNLLKEALSKVLVPFHPFAGRYGRDENGRMEINCNGEGVLFVEAEADCPMTDFNDITPGRQYLVLAPRIDCSTDISSFPFCLVQVTKFSCGGVSLVVSSHHQAVDGQSMAYFINSWSETARGLSLTIPPAHERTLLRPRHPPSPKFHHIEYDPIPISKPKTEDKLSVAIVKFPFEFVNSLKAKVNNKDTNVKYTTFEILSAHIWRCTSKSRNLSNDQPNALQVPVDGRRRLCPPLPNGYFGNAIFHATTTTTVSTGEMVSESLEKTVERIHNAINQMNDDYLKSGIDYLEKKNQSNRPIGVAKTTFVINSWARLDVARSDFGWGRPTCMRPAGEAEGYALFLPSINEDNDLSVLICLLDQHIKSLEKLLYVLE